jgi:hypothetical protein
MLDALSLNQYPHQSNKDRIRIKITIFIRFGLHQQGRYQLIIPLDLNFSSISSSGNEPVHHRANEIYKAILIRPITVEGTFEVQLASKDNMTAFGVRSLKATVRFAIGSMTPSNIALKIIEKFIFISWFIVK